MTKKYTAFFLVLASLLVLGAGCAKQPAKENANSNPTAPSPVGNSSAIEIKDFAFAPATTTVQAGTIVVWSNNDSAVHQIKSDLFESPDLAQGQNFEFRFSQPGTFDYVCSLHPDMKGQVVVQ